jgi:hypothetical protein
VLQACSMCCKRRSSAQSYRVSRNELFDVCQMHCIVCQMPSVEQTTCIRCATLSRASPCSWVAQEPLFSAALYQWVAQEPLYSAALYQQQQQRQQPKQQQRLHNSQAHTSNTRTTANIATQQPHDAAGDTAVLGSTGLNLAGSKPLRVNNSHTPK